MWQHRRLTILWTATACYRDTFTIFLLDDVHTLLLRSTCILNILFTNRYTVIQMKLFSNISSPDSCDIISLIGKGRHLHAKPRHNQYSVSRADHYFSWFCPWSTKNEFISLSLSRPYFFEGRAIAQALSRRFPTAAAWVRSQVRSSRICGWQRGTEAGFLRPLRFPLPIFIPLTIPQSSCHPGLTQLTKQWPMYQVDWVSPHPKTLHSIKNLGMTLYQFYSSTKIILL
jgi:hypothetical protein